MPKYDRGDVVLVHFPFKDTDEMKVRPAVILRLEGDKERCLMQVTKTNRSDKLPGYFVPMKSDHGIKMRLLHDSFINITEQRTLNLHFIIRKIGYCPLIDKIESWLEEIDSN